MVSKNYIMNMGIKYNVDQNSVNQVRQSIQSLIDDTDRLGATVKLDPGKQIDASLQSAVNTANKLGDILQESFNVKLNTLDITRFSESMTKSGLDAKTLKMELEKLGPEGSSVFNRLSSEVLGMNIELKKSNTLLDKMALTFANTIRFGISSSIFNNFTGSISKAYGYVQKLDKSLNDIRIVSDASAQDMKEFAQYANQAAQSLGASTLDYTNAALIYYQQGLPEEQVKERSNITVKMANVLGTSASEVSDYMTAIWNNFDDGSKSLEYYADVLTSLGAKTASSAEEISTGLEKFAAISGTVGLSYEYAAAALTTVTDRTRQSAEVVGTAFKTLFARIQDLELGKTLDDGTTLGKYSEALQAVGINIKDQNGQLKDMDIILDEMGAKWNLLSKDQQVALAQNVAGVRQYTQLIALMDNWDFFQQNIEWAADATGELNKQQDIFAQSLQAHLNSMAASKEALYNNLFNTDEIIPVVDLLANITKGINDMVSAFGGGAKALAGFAGMFSSVFYKQIDQGLVHLTTNTNIAKENAQKLAVQLDQAKQGISIQGGTPEELANIKALETQLENYNRMTAAYELLNDEQIKRLNQIQQENSELERQNVLLDEQSKIISNKELNKLNTSLNIDNNLNTTEGEKQDIINYNDNVYLQENAQNLDLINQKLGEMVEQHNNYIESLEQSTAQLEKDLDLYDIETGKLYEIENLQEEIANIITLKEEQSGKSQSSQQLQILQNQLKQENLTVKKKKEILETVKEIVKNEKKNTEQVKATSKAIAAQKDAQEKIKSNKQKTSNLNREQENILKPIEKAQPAIATVNTLTSAVSALTSAWAMGSNVAATWKDVIAGNTSIGEALIRTLTSATMIIPSLISAYKAWNSVIAISNAQKATEQALSASHLVIHEAILAGKTEEEATELALNAVKQTGVAIDIEKTQAELAEVAAQEMSNKAAEESVVALGADATAKGIDAAVTGVATAAQTAFNAAVWANPLTWLVVVLMGAVAAVAIFASAAKKSAQAQMEANQATIDETNAKQAEIDKNDELMEQYLAAYENYKKGKISKQQLAETTKDLNGIVDEEILRVAQLTGNYDELTEAITKNRKAKLEEGLESAKKENSAAKDLVLSKAREDRGYLNSSGKYVLNWYDGADLSDEGLFYYAMNENTSFDRTVDQKGAGVTTYTYTIDFDEKSIAEAYHELEKVRDYINDNYTAEQRSKSESYKDMVEWLDKMKDSVEAYENSLKDLEKYSTELEILNLDISGIESYDDFTEVQDKIIEKLKSIDENKDKTDEELKKLANTYLLSTNSNLQEFIDKQTLIEAAIKSAGDGKYTKRTVSEDETAYIKHSHVDENGNVVEDKVQYFTNDQVKEAMGKLSTEDIQTLLASGEDLGWLLQGMYVREEQLGEGTLSLEEKLQALAQGFRANKDYVVPVNEELSNLLKTLDVSDSEFQEYVKQLMKMNPELKNNEKEAKEIALANIRMNKGLSDLADNFDDLKKPLKENKQGTQEFAQALDKMQGIMGNILDIDGEDLSDSFYTSAKNLKLMEQAANGSTEAVEKLRQEAGNDIIAQVLAEAQTDQAKDAIKSIDEMIDNINTKNLKPGASIDLSQFNTDSAEFEDKLNEMIAASGMTAEQVNAYLSSMGYEAEIETTPSTQLVHYSGVYPHMQEDGELKLIPWKTDVEEEVQIPTIKSLNYKGPAAKTVNLNNGKGKSGGSSKSKNVEMTKTDVDRYHPINTQIEKVDKSLQKLQKDQEKLTGKSKFDNLTKQWQLLNQQAQNYNTKLNIAKQEQAELRNTLAQQGVTFNADGTVSNYEQAIRAQEAKLNNLKQQYNKLSEKQKEKWDEQGILDKAEKEFDEFLENIDRLDEITVSLIPELETDNLDIELQKIENKISQLNLEIDLKLNTAEAERDWNSFRKRIIDKIDDDDIFGNAKSSAADLKTYISADNSGQLDVTNAYLQYLLTHENDFAANPVKYQEELEKTYQAAMEQLEAVQDIVDELKEDVLNALDQAQEKLDEQIDTYQQLDSILQHDTKLIQLALGDKAYDQLAQIYEKQHDNNLQQLSFYQLQIDYWKEIRDGYELGSEAWENANEKMKEAQENTRQQLEKTIESTATVFENRMNILFDKFNKDLSKNFGLEYLDEEWDLINKNADTYLDTINQIQGINDLEQKYLDAINKSSNPAIQQKIQNIMNQQVNLLREKDKLTKSDLDMAQKRYDLYLAQIALEEAQQNKSIMRLRRDSQGNYTYQYSADTAAVDKAQQDVDAKRNALYNENKNRIISDIENIQKTNEEMQQKIQKAMNDGDIEMVKLYQDQYSKWLSENRTEFAQHLSELDEAIAEEWLAKTGEDFTTASIERQQEIRRQLVPQLEALSKYSVDNLTSDKLVQLFEEARQWMAEKEATQDNDLINGNRNRDELLNGYNEEFIATQELLSNQEDLLEAQKQSIDIVSDFVNATTARIEALEAERDIVNNTTEAYQKLTDARNAEGNEYAQKLGMGTASNTYGQEGVNTGTYNAAIEEYKVLVNDTLEKIAKLVYGSASEDIIQHIMAANGLSSSTLTAGQVLRFASGGYTGDWAGASRLAALDQKELVLNSDDTANMLNTIAIMRNLTYSLGATTLARLAGVGAAMPNGSSSDSALEQNVHIDASFPNVTNSREIEEAFNNLVNAASQRIFKR